MTIKYKKKLGQNFLVDKNILKKIINFSLIKNHDCILEIGPGSGNLTNEILKKNPKKMKVIEKDENLIPILLKKFDKKIDILNCDILKIDEKKLFESKCKVFGNLPYNISTKIISKWILNLDDEPWFDEMYLMFQKEVAERIIANVNTKNYGRISILSNWKFNIEKIVDIYPSSFKPKPKVDSTLLVFTPKNEFYNLKNSKNLEYITNIFFSQKRKMIKKPLKFLFKNFEDISKKLSLDLNSRPQNLDNLTYYKICDIYETLIN